MKVYVVEQPYEGLITSEAFLTRAEAEVARDKYVDDPRYRDNCAVLELDLHGSEKIDQVRAAVLAIADEIGDPTRDGWNHSGITVAMSEDLRDWTRRLREAVT